MSTTNISSQEKYYNRYYSEQSRFINNLRLERAIAILNIINSNFKLKDNPPVIYDLGCGSGWLTSILALLGKTTGFDLSKEAISKASRLYPQAKFENINIYELDEYFNTADIVVSQEVIEHFEDQISYLRIAHKLLKPGGILILTTPNAKTFHAMPEYQKNYWAAQPIENWLESAELKKLLLNTNFSMGKVTTIIPKYGSKGWYRVWNSKRLLNLLAKLKLSDTFIKLRLKWGYGMHLLAVAKKDTL